MSEEKLYTIDEVAQMAGVTREQLYYARKQLWIEKDKLSKPKIKFTESEAQNYMRFVKERNENARTLDFDLTQNYKFLPCTPRVHKFFGDPEKFQSGIIFAVGDSGTVVNCNKMKQMTPYEGSNGYLQINLQNGYQPLVQTLVGLMFCPNAKYKVKFHHINGDRKDNRAVNLLAVTDKEHGQAHKLLNEILKTNSLEELSKAQRAYEEFIATVQEDNREPVKEDLRVIDDLDFPNNPEDGHKSFMFVTEKSYQKYLTTGNEADLVIRVQFFK